MDLFESGIFSFGTDLLTEPSEPKKKERVQKKQEEYPLPLYILMDGLEPIFISKEDKTAITRQEVFSRINEELATDLFTKHEHLFQITKVKDRLIVRPDPSTKVAKSNEGRQILHKGSLMNVSTLIDPGDNASVSAEEITKYLSTETGLHMELYLVGDTYFPALAGTDTFDVQAASFPLTVHLLSGEELEITEELYYSSDPEHPDTGIEEERLLQVIYQLVPQYEGEYALYQGLQENTAILALKQEAKKSAEKKPEQDALYPTDGIISLVFTKIPLNPMQFDGREQISKKELLKFLQKTYPEYSAERTEIQYDKKKKLIMPILKSGKRGACEKYLLEDTSEYRHENTFMMDLFVRKRADTAYPEYFRWKLPKIPFALLHRILQFFQSIYARYKSEAMAQIYWSKERKIYYIYIPVQSFCQDSVTFHYGTFLKDTLVLEIHSHGSFPAFWSGTDDREELSHCLYGVVGSLQNFRLFGDNFILRAGSGGYHLKIDPFEVFELPTATGGICQRLQSNETLNRR